MRPAPEGCQPKATVGVGGLSRSAGRSEEPISFILSFFAFLKLCQIFFERGKSAAFLFRSGALASILVLQVALGFDQQLLFLEADVRGGCANAGSVLLCAWGIMRHAHSIM